MQKKIISIILCAALLVPFTACGTVSDSTPTDSGLTSNVESSETVSTEETVSSELVSSNAASSEETQSEDVSEVSSALTSSAQVDSSNPASAEKEESSESQQPDKYIDFSISTSQTTAGFDDPLCAIAEEKGVVINKDSETLSFTATDSVCSEIANEYRNYYNEQPESDTSTIKKIVINESYDTVEFYVTSEYTNSMDGLGVLLFTHVMTTLQLLSGKDSDSVRYTNKVINIETNEIISETILPDDLEQ